jgi:hypothetical protein
VNKNTARPASLRYVFFRRSVGMCGEVCGVDRGIERGKRCKFDGGEVIAAGK